MTPSISKDKLIKIRKFWPALIWLLLWQIVAIVIGSEIILASPISVIKRLFNLALTIEFWNSIVFSLVRITVGFFLAVIIGTLLAILSYKSKLFRAFLEPFIKTIRSIPVASFIILVLLWISSSNLNIIISFLIVLPIIYSNVLEGIFNTNKELIEMSSVFELTNWKRIRYIYISQVMPFFISACKISLGLAWKSGIAAEVIGLPIGSIGESLYQSKIFLDTSGLFAWTLAIVLLSISFEKLFIYFLEKLERKLEK